MRGVGILRLLTIAKSDCAMRGTCILSCAPGSFSGEGETGIFFPTRLPGEGACAVFRLRYLVKSADVSTKAVTAGQGRLCQSRLIEVLGGLVHRDKTANDRLTSDPCKLERSTQRPNAFAHARQASTERSVIGKADSIIDNRHGDLGLLEAHTNPER